MVQQGLMETANARSDGGALAAVDLSQIRTLFIDCDDTLYPPSAGVAEKVRENIDQYMREKLRIPEGEVVQLREELYVKYGTTLRGLQVQYQVDPNHYWDFVHGTLDYDHLIQPNPRLVNLLKSLPQRKWVLTNANEEHATETLRRLGMEDEGIFEGIIDVRRMNFENKPSAVAYQTALKIAGEPDPSRAIMIDDSAGNLEGARRMGMHTVRVHPSARPSPTDLCLLTSLDDGLLLRKCEGLWKFHP